MTFDRFTKQESPELTEDALKAVLDRFFKEEVNEVLKVQLTTPDVLYYRGSQHTEKAGHFYGTTAGSANEGKKVYLDSTYLSKSARKYRVGSNVLRLFVAGHELAHHIQNHPRFSTQAHLRTFGLEFADLDEKAFFKERSIKEDQAYYVAGVFLRWACDKKVIQDLDEGMIQGVRRYVQLGLAGKIFSFFFERSPAGHGSPEHNIRLFDLGFKERNAKEGLRLAFRSVGGGRSM